MVAASSKVFGRVLVALVALLLMVGTWFLYFREAPGLKLAFASGDVVSVTSAKNYGAIALENAGNSEGVDLLRRYLTSETLEQYNQLYAQGEDPGLSAAAFESWRKRRDAMQKLVDDEYQLKIGDSSFNLIVYQNVQAGSVLVDNLLQKQSAGRWVPVRSEENLRFRPLKDFFKQITKLGIDILVRSGSHSSILGVSKEEASVVDGKIKDILRGIRIRGNQIDATKYFEALAQLEKSDHIMDRRIAALLMRPSGVHAASLVDKSAITAEIRARHSALIDFMRAKHVPEAHYDDVLVYVLNRQYTFAAQKMREWSGNQTEAIHDYVMKIREIYGPVIQVYDSSQKGILN